MEKRADTQIPIHELLARRWSPRAFADHLLTPEQLHRLLEAARWAPSCFNEQPWAFILATRDQSEDFDRLLTCLMEGNRVWAKRASVLILTFAKRVFGHDQTSNRHAWHDVGLAVGNLVVQATAMNLSVHQMGGILPDKIHEIFPHPMEYEAVTGLAIGFQGDPNLLPEPIRKREQAARERKPLEEWVFSGQWGENPNFLK